MELLISVSAEGFKKGDRIVAKVGRGEWLQGVIQTSGAKLKITFDDKSTATVDAEDFKDVKQIPPKTKKNKEVITTSEAKALIKLAGTPVPPKLKLSKKDPLKPKKAAVGTKGDHAATKAKREVQKVVEKEVRKPDMQKKAAPGKLPPSDALHPEKGYVFSINGNTKISNPSDEFIVTDLNYGTKLIRVGMTKIKGGTPGKLNLFHWPVRIGARKSRRFGMALPMGEPMGIPFKYLRKATQAEMDHAVGKREVLKQSYAKRTDDNLEAQNKLGIQPGDTVMVGYTNGMMSELVTDINWKTGKVAVHKPGREARGMKRRFIHIKHIRSIITKGPGFYKAPTF